MATTPSAGTSGTATSLLVVRRLASYYRAHGQSSNQVLALSARQRRARSAPAERVPGELEHLDPLETDELEADSESSSFPLRSFSLLVWSARHDNDWVTIVCEQPDGTFAVIAAPVTARNVTPDDIATTAGIGKVTAEQTLREKSGHAHCSPACEAWQERRELVMVAR